MANFPQWYKDKLRREKNKFEKNKIHRKMARASRKVNR